MSPKEIKTYLTETYGLCKHDPIKMSKACKSLAKKHKCSPTDMFYFIVEDVSIPELYTTSYGFHTENGRAIKKEFSNVYNSL